MKSAKIRQKFLDYFKSKGHEIVSSSSLIPVNDPTLLFTNAGMVQFKDVFLGLDKRAYTKAASSQRCVRAGGKHNDLENVGYTARHHTFFEMLGNFSFGNYFKEDAIRYAWEFLTQVLGIPKQRLWVTVFENDDEAADIWLNIIKVDPARLTRCGEKDNFWAMGDTGPCGPCTEIFYDHGPSIEGGPPGSPDAEGDRYVEIWNLVFMQYNRFPNGEMHPLPKPSVDTGMGLERIAAVMQGVHNNYDIDLFRRLIQATAKLYSSLMDFRRDAKRGRRQECTQKYMTAATEFCNKAENSLAKSIAKTKDEHYTSLRVIADHIRSCAFLIADGVTPSNEGRGYVLRRIIRRALRHGHQLGLNEPFFYQLVDPLIIDMGDVYPELVKAETRVKQTLKREEELFAQTLDQGLRIFEQTIADLKTQTIPGELVFRLYDTFGFPLDLTADIARERGYHIDEVGFEREMAQQRTRSQEASKFGVTYILGDFALDKTTLFTGYETLTQESEIIRLLHEGKSTERLETGEKGIMILAKSAFYSESGGQIGDRGVIKSKNAVFVVHDTQSQGQAILHYGEVKEGQFSNGDQVIAIVDDKRRLAAARNHSATHLLNAALRNLLGDHVIQKGSLVEPERLRFDFSHFEPLQPQQIRALEHLVNLHIRANHPVITKIMTPEQAMDSGAIALFGEKYGDEVRVLCMGDFSMELCGGTHVAYTGQIGLFKIISETGIASGIRRIEALTGEYALNWIDSQEDQLKQICQRLKIGRDNLTNKLDLILESARQTEKEVERLQAKMAVDLGDELLSQAQEFSGIKILATLIETSDSKVLREIIDKLKQKSPKSVILLAAREGEKINMVAGVTSNLTQQIKANELISYVANQVGGKGGGRPDIAQGGGDKPENLTQALSSVYAWVQKKL